MREYLKFYIDGQWVDPVELRTLDVDNPTTRRGRRQDRHRLRGRRGQGGQGRSQGVQRLVAVHSRRTPRRAAGHPGRISEARRRPRRRGARGNGCAAVAGVQLQVDDGSGAPGHRHRRAEELLLRGAARRHAWWSRNRSGSAGSSRRGTGRSTRSPARCSRRWPPAARWCSSRPRSRPSPGRSSPRSSTRPGCLPVCTTWSSATGRVWARRCPAIPASTWCRSPGPRAPASRSPATPHRRSSGWPRNSAARARTSCSTTRPSRRASPPASR